MAEASFLNFNIGEGEMKAFHSITEKRNSLEKNEHKNFHLEAIPSDDAEHIHI